MSKLVYTCDLVFAAIRADGTTWINLITGQIVVTDKVLAWLVHIMAVWQFLSSKERRSGFAAIVRAMALSNFNGVISQVIVNDVGQVLTEGEEAKHLTIVVQELFL